VSGSTPERRHTALSPHDLALELSTTGHRQELRVHGADRTGWIDGAQKRIERPLRDRVATPPDDIGREGYNRPEVAFAPRVPFPPSHVIREAEIGMHGSIYADPAVSHPIADSRQVGAGEEGGRWTAQDSGRLRAPQFPEVEQGAGRRLDVRPEDHPKLGGLGGKPVENGPRSTISPNSDPTSR
jgi:hypothetical protein